MMTGTVMSTSLLKRDSRAHAPNIEPKPIAHSTKTRPSRLLDGTPSNVGLSSGSQTLDFV